MDSYNDPYLSHQIIFPGAALQFAYAFLQGFTGESRRRAQQRWDNSFILL